MMFTQVNNAKEVFKIKSEYFKLDNDKKKKVLEDISNWVQQQINKL